MGAIVHTLLALKTAGVDPNKFGPQVAFENNPFWADVIPAYLHALSPVPVTITGWEWLGPSYQLASYGDSDKIVAENSMKIFGPLGIYYSYVGNAVALNGARWIETYGALGGLANKISRIQGSMSSNGSARNAIFAFMLFDPAAGEPTDARAALPLTYFGEGINRLLARTSWGSDARWLTYILNWNRVDHQQGDGNMIEFYRKGEWLTKNWLGYGERAASSEFKNTLALQNDAPKFNSAGSYQNIQWLNGSQWQYIGAGDPKLVAKSLNDNFIAITGDSTNLYNSTSDGATDIVHASRSFVWIKPDYVVIYDRAQSKTAGRFKRFWLNLQNQPVIKAITGGIQAAMTTPNGQKFYVTTLLPANANVTSTTDRQTVSYGDQSAQGEIMKYRLKVEAPNGPQNVRFLHVLQGSDAAADVTSTFDSTAGTAFQGAVVKNYAVVFPVDLNSAFSGTTYKVPATVTKQYVTGLKPNTGYTYSTQSAGGNLTVILSEGGNSKADAGGVLTIQ